MRERFVRFKALPCLDELEVKLTHGEKLQDVVAWLRQKGELPDLQDSTLMSQLSMYRKEGMSTGKILEAHRNSGPVADQLRAAEDRLATGLDEVDELETLYRLQEERIKNALTMEQKLKILNPRIGTEVMSMVAILKTRHDIKMDLQPTGAGRNLGVLQTQNQNVNLELGTQYTDSVKEAVQNPEVRAKVLGVLRNMLSSKAARNDSE